MRPRAGGPSPRPSPAAPAVRATVRHLPDEHVWLRVADAAWDEPLDPSWARDHGGRWNPPRSFAALYLNEDRATARAQVHRLLAGSPVHPEDLRDDAPYVLVAARLPRRQAVAGALDDAELVGLGLGAAYPLDRSGAPVPHEACQPIGVVVHHEGHRGVWCRSAATPAGDGRELAWFPASSVSRATAVGVAVPFSEWWPPEPTGPRPPAVPD